MNVRRRKWMVLGLAAVLAAVVAGCGVSSGDEGTTTVDRGSGGATTTTADGSDDPTSTTSDSEDAASKADYVAALEADLQDGDASAGDLVFEADQATCLAPRWIDIITVQRLRDAGIEPEDMPDLDLDTLGVGESDALQMVDAFASCDIDVASQVAASLTSDLSADDQSCARLEIDVTLVDDLFVAGFSGADQDTIDAAYQAVLDQLADACSIDFG